jgi:hypothetical protein
MLVYISGNHLFAEKFNRAEMWLRLNNHKVINFEKIRLPISEMSTQQYMGTRYFLLGMCDAIFMVDGWQESKVSCAELAYAKSLGKKVFYQDYYKEFRKNEKRNSDGEQ